MDIPSESEQSRHGHSERGRRREALKSAGPTYQARLKLEAAKEWIDVARHGQSLRRDDHEKTVILCEAAEVLDDWIGRLREIE